MPLVKGWLRASLRAIDTNSPSHRPYLPHRNYASTDVSFLEPNELYLLLVEIWPTCVVVEAGSSIVFEVATGDTQGAAIFLHNDESDRSEATFDGTNVIHLGEGQENWLQLPIV